MTYRAAKSQALDAVGRQLDSVSTGLLSDTASPAAYLELSDGELEYWFSRHRSELVNLIKLDMAPIAAWLPAIGPPANDNAPLSDS